MTNINKETGFTFICNEAPDCESCITFAVCYNILKDHTYPKQGLREIASLKCPDMLNYLTYTYYDKNLGIQGDISYRRICIVLDCLGIVLDPKAFTRYIKEKK